MKLSQISIDAYLRNTQHHHINAEASGSITLLGAGEYAFLDFETSGGKPLVQSLYRLSSNRGAPWEMKDCELTEVKRCVAGDYSEVPLITQTFRGQKQGARDAGDSAYRMQLRVLGDRDGPFQMLDKT